MKIRRNLRVWLAIAVTGLGLVLFGYVLAQQSLRLNANDPQRQMAEDAAARLDGAAKPADVIGSGQAVDARHSLAPFIVVTDMAGHAKASLANLTGLALPPESSFKYAREHSGNAITWQPAPGVRQAAVIISYERGYVLAARSLRQVEVNYEVLNKLAVLTALGVVLAPAVILLLLP